MPKILMWSKKCSEWVDSEVYVEWLQVKCGDAVSDFFVWFYCGALRLVPICETKLHNLQTDKSKVKKSSHF